MGSTSESGNELTTIKQRPGCPNQTLGLTDQEQPREKNTNGLRKSERWKKIFDSPTIAGKGGRS